MISLNSNRLARVIASLLVYCFTFSAHAEELKSGALANVYNRVLNKIKDDLPKAAGVSISVVHYNNIGQMTKDVIDGKLDFAAASYPIELWKKIVTARNIPFPDTILSRVVGSDQIFVIANKQNSVSSLTHEQLKNVFQGRVKNWKEIGGADLPVRIATHKTLSAKNDIFSFLALKGQPIAGNIEPIDFPEEGDYMAAIEKMPGAIGIITVDKASDKVQLVKTSVLGRPLTVISNGKPSDSAQKVFAYIRDRKDLLQ